MRTMYDSVNAVGIPEGATMVAGYIDGDFQSFNPIVARFPNAVHVSITVHTDGVADLLDIEAGNPAAEQAPGWVAKMRQLNRIPGVYCSLSVVPKIVGACLDKGVALPLFAVADWDDDPTFPSVPAGVVVVSKQYSHDIPHNGSGYDVSSVVDHWPGVDASPKAAALPPATALTTSEVKPMPNIALYVVTDVPEGTPAPGIFALFVNTGGYVHVSPTQGSNNIKALRDSGAIGPLAITFAQHRNFLTMSHPAAPVG